MAPLQPGPQQYVTTGTDRSSSASARSGTSAVGRWTAPGTCPWSQEAVDRVSTRTKPGSVPSAAAVARTEATSETSAWKARLAEKYAAAAAGEAGGVRSTGLTCGVVVMLIKLGPKSTALKWGITAIEGFGR